MFRHLHDLISRAEQYFTDDVSFPRAAEVLRVQLAEPALMKSSARQCCSGVPAVGLVPVVSLFLGRRGARYSALEVVRDSAVPDNDQPGDFEAFEAGPRTSVWRISDELIEVGHSLDMCVRGSRDVGVAEDWRYSRAQAHWKHCALVHAGRIH